MYPFLVLHIFLDFSRNVGPEPYVIHHFPIYLLKGFKDGSWQRQTEMNFSIYAALVCNMNGVEDPMSLFTSILKDIAQEIIAKTTAVQKRYNKP